MSQKPIWTTAVQLAAAITLVGSLTVAPATHAEGHNTGKISFSAGVDFTTEYYFRGIIQEDQGLISQPWMEASIAINEKLGLTFGIWNSFHDNHTGAAGSGDKK